MAAVGVVDLCDLHAFVGVLQQFAQPAPRDRVVVSDQHPLHNRA
jgi:hypothetical protein